MPDQTPTPLDYGTAPRKPFWPRSWIVWAGLVIGFGATLVDIIIVELHSPPIGAAPTASTRSRTPGNAGNRPGSMAADAVQIRKVIHKGNAFTVAEIDLTRATLRLFWKKPGGDRYGRFGNIKADLERSGERLLFATNAGIFDPSFTPCGLHVEDGRECVPLNLRSGSGNFFLKPNGVFLVDAQGARVIDAATYGGTRADIRVAVQSGPLLVLDGRIHPAFKPGSSSTRKRSGVGILSARRVIFAISDEPVTFHAFASLFVESLNCRNTLYLDGVISQFYIPSVEPGAESGDYAGIMAVTTRE
ncbi:MAG: phosphodiester glycosidase family protein [Tepidisphaerales bacterium]